MHRPPFKGSVATCGSGHHIGQYRHRTFPPSQKVLLDGADQSLLGGLCWILCAEPSVLGNMESHTQVSYWVRTGSDEYHSCPHPLGQKAMTWPQPNFRGSCGGFSMAFKSFTTGFSVPSLFHLLLFHFLSPPHVVPRSEGTGF